MIGRNVKSPLSCLIPSAIHLPSCAASMPTAVALTPEQKREIIGKLLKVSPEKSDRQVAKLTGVSHPHVGKVRRSLEQTGDVETVSTSTDTKGHKQPRTKKRPKVPREVATHSHQDVGPESPREIARKLARLEELESTTRSLERENIRLKSESATLSVNAFIGAGREERRRFLDGSPCGEQTAAPPARERVDQVGR